MKGFGAQEMPLQMLSSLLSRSPLMQLPELSVYTVTGEMDTPGMLSSTLYRRWLLRMAPNRVLHGDDGVPTNLGTSVLVEAFETDSRLYERCLADANEVDNPEYRRRH